MTVTSAHTDLNSCTGLAYRTAVSSSLPCLVLLAVTDNRLTGVCDRSDRSPGFLFPTGSNASPSDPTAMEMFPHQSTGCASFRTRTDSSGRGERFIAPPEQTDFLRFMPSMNSLQAPFCGQFTCGLQTGTELFRLPSLIPHRPICHPAVLVSGLLSFSPGLRGGQETGRRKRHSCGNTNLHWLESDAHQSRTPTRGPFSARALLRLNTDVLSVHQSSNHRLHPNDSRRTPVHRFASDDSHADMLTRLMPSISFLPPVAHKDRPRRLFAARQ